MVLLHYTKEIFYRERLFPYLWILLSHVALQILKPRLELKTVIIFKRLNLSIVYNIEHFISEGNSFMVYIYIYIYIICI